MKFLNFLKAFITYLGFFLVVACLIAKQNVDLLFKNFDGSFNAVGQVLVKLSGEGFYFFPFMFIPIIMILGHLIFGLLENASGFSPKANLIIGISSVVGLCVVQVLLRTLFKIDSFFSFYALYPNYDIVDTVPLFRILNIAQLVLTFILGFCFYSFFVGDATYEYVTITTYYDGSGMEVDSKTSDSKFAIWLHILLGILTTAIPLVLGFSPLVIFCIIPFILFLIRHSSVKTLVLKAVVFTLVCGLLITPVVLTSTGTIHVDKILYSFNKEKTAVIVKDIDCNKDIKRLTIANEYWGYNVEKINNGVLMDFQKIEELVIPTLANENLGTLFIEKDSQIPGRYVPESLKTLKLTNQQKIWRGNLTYVNLLEKIFLTENTKYIDFYAFEGENIKFNIHDNFNYIGTEDNPYYAAIVGNEYGKILKYHKDTVTIANSYVNSNELEAVIIPKSVKYFSASYFFTPESSFNKIPNLKGFYYEGAFEDAINMELILNGHQETYSLNFFKGILNTIPIYYYSEVEPVKEGLFWRYAEDNTTPLIWE